MDDNTNDNDESLAQWAEDFLSHTNTPEQIAEIKASAEREAQEQHRMDTTDWVAKLKETNDQIRAQEEVRVRAQLDVEQPGHGYSDEDIKVYVAQTHSDAANKRRSWEHQKVLMTRAQVAHDAAEVVKEQAAVTRAHNTALTTERKKVTTFKERAEAAESKAKGLEAQLAGLWKGQRS
jgi:hypothetical protein